MWINGFWDFGFWMPTILKSVSWSNASIGWLIVISMSLALIGIVNGISSSRTEEKRWHVAIPCLLVHRDGLGIVRY